MKLKVSALRKLLIEALGKDKLLRERPWSAEYTFTLSGGEAADSEGTGPDGFAIVLTGESGKIMRVVVDSYWNPTSGDESGNSLRIEYEEEKTSTYVPTRFDDGKQQRLMISNTPVPGIISVAHSAESPSIPIVYLFASNPFDAEEDVSFSVEALGNGKADVKLTGHTNV